MTRKMYPVGDGGQQAVNMHYKLFHEMGVALYGVMSNVDDDCTDWRSYMPEFVDLLVLLRCHPQVRTSPVKALGGYLLSGKPRRAQVIESKTNMDRVSEYINEKHIDAIVVETIYGLEHLDLPYLKAHNIPVIIVEHNVEYIYQRESLARFKFLASEEIRRTKRYEAKNLPLVNAVVAISPTDLKILTQDFALKNIDYIPFPYLPKVIWENKSSKYIVFNGSLNTYVNYFSMQRFFSTVWPRFTAEHPDIELVITGRVTDEIRQEFSYPQVRFTGFIDDNDLYRLLAECMFLISPIIIGSGAKLKLIEGLAMNIPVVATKHCFEGVPFTEQDGQPHLVAENANMFAEHMSSLTCSQHLRETISAAAARFFTKNYSVASVKAKWQKLLERVVP